jgi:excisionase family DNA binding protein
MNDYTKASKPITSTPNTISEQLLLRVGTAAELLDVSRSTMYSLIHKRVVPAIRVGKSIRISVDDLRTWIALQPQVSG